MNMNNSLRYLSPPLIKAINQGQYTNEQVQELVRQKESVREAVQDDTRPTTSSSTTEESTTFSEIPESTTFSPNTSGSLDEELRAAYDWQTLHKVWQSEVTRQESQEPTDQQQQQRVLPTDTEFGPLASACGFKICATCRPTYRERAFQSLDEVVKNPKWPPQWELDNRRVSDARVVRNIGLTHTTRFYAQPNGQGIESQNTFASHYPSSQDEAHLENGTDEESSSKRHSRSGFRETVRNALKQARNEQQTCLDKEASDKSGINTSTESLTPFRRSMIFMRRKSRPSIIYGDSSTKVVDNDSLQNSLNLMLASNTPLPPSGPNTPMYPPSQKKRDSDDNKKDAKTDGGEIIAHA